MMMSLGLFLFEIGTLPYQQLARSSEYRFAESERFGARSAQQFTGEGDDKITLSGALYSGDGFGDFTAIQTLRDMAAAGQSYPLISGTGEIMGQWSIRALDETRTVFFVDGVARKADFTLSLKRGDDA